MLFYFTSRIISSTAAFLYPCYASYKTLSQRPASEEDLERWLMYWSVLGCIVGVEYLAEWLISWLPFYYPIKTLFLLYLSLPQTRGSSYLYKNHLQPFLHTYEADIDAALASLKVRVYTFVQERLRILWEHVAVAIGQSSSASAAEATPGVGQAGGAGAPPTLNDPISGPAQIIGGLWRSYGPSIIASGAALLQQQSARAGAGGSASAFFDTAASRSPQRRPSPPGRQDTTQSVLERRRQLEAELATLAAVPDAHAPAQPLPEPLPLPGKHGSTSFLPTSPAGSDADLRARVSQYEEVEVPSDVEGYDVGGPSTRARGGAEQGHPSDGAGVRRNSWFGWAYGAGSPGKEGYERVKDE